jgi:RND family efflux transporter MFP subunit
VHRLTRNFAASTYLRKESAMPLADVENPRDPLATLRIARTKPSNPTGSRRPWLRRLRVVTLLVVLAVVGLVVASVTGLKSVMKGFEPRMEVRVANVSVQTGRSADAVVVATGYLESRRQAKIGARAQGRIELLHVEEGSHVKKGEVLAALEHADLDASLAANKAELERTRAALAEQEVVVDRTKREYDRAVKLQPSRTITETELDIARFDYEGAVAKIKSLKASVSLADARVREAEQVRENMFVRAPFDGTVISKDAEVGESILPGGLGEGSGRGSVVTIADLASLEVDCDVKEDYISRVVVDRPAEVSVDAVPGRRYKGKVRKVIPMGDRARATIKVKVAIVDADERLFPEMSGTVYFLPSGNESETASTDRRIFCPSDAIVKEADASHVWVVKDEKAERVKVRVGSETDNRAEILGGLSGGERVVVKPAADLRDGRLVKVAE